MGKIIRKLMSIIGYHVIKVGKNDERYIDFDEIHNTIWDEVRENTMTSKERIYGLIEAVKYISNNKIEGDIVECGVWRGGSMMSVAKTLQRLKDTDRNLYLYDTFEGMSEPTEEDADFTNTKASNLLEKDKTAEKRLVWAYSTFETVKKAMDTTGYPDKNIEYVRGKVEDTIPGKIPEKIALLRLDTDWYESTKHELEYLFPRLQKGGVLIIDDYGYWKGARKAVDEYFEANKTQILLCRMDNTGRIAIKL